MAGRPVYDRTTYLEDIRALKRRGRTDSQVIAALGISRATYYRIVKQPPTTAGPTR